MLIHDWTRVPAGLFHHFHHGWTASLSSAFNCGLLPRGYYALSEQVAAGPIPDVLTVQQEHPPGAGPSGNGNVAVLTAQPHTRFVQSAEPERYAAKANRITIRHPLGQVVAVVEIVSPGNKESRHALRSFVEKSVGFIEQGINLLVIDLFPPTPRDPQGIHKAIWDEIREETFELPADKPLTLVSYSAGPTKTAYIEPVAVGDELPSMPLYLAPGQYVPAPLEPTYMTTWSACPQPMKELLEP